MTDIEAHEPVGCVWNSTKLTFGKEKWQSLPKGLKNEYQNVLASGGLGLQGSSNQTNDIITTSNDDIKGEIFFYQIVSCNL